MARSPIDRLRTVCLALPEAFEKVSHGEPTFWVHKRMFAMFANADNHHGGGRHSVWCKATHTTQDMLVTRRPDRYFVPPYVGPSGWFGIYMDKKPDWKDVAQWLEESYRLVAPKRLLSQMDERANLQRRER